MKLVVDRVCVDLAGRSVLADVSLEVSCGQIVGLVGPNGSGKSTLLRTIYRSLRPRNGAVLVDDVDVWSLSPRHSAQRVAAVLQHNLAPEALTVEEVVALGRTPHHGLLGREGVADRQAVTAALDHCGVDRFAGRPYGSLSGGERQRVLVARALAQQPRVLVLDEPTNHLDIRARFELLDLIRGTGLTTLAVLHDLDLAARTCDQLVVLDAGRVVVAGPVLDVLTPDILRKVFGVAAHTARHDDGVVRVTYAAIPLASEDAPQPQAQPA